MAPLSLITANVSLLAKSFSVLSCTSALARCASVLPTAYAVPVKYLTSQTSGPPKRPLNGYMRYLLQQRAVVVKQNPEVKPLDLIRKIAQQWKTLSPGQKQPFQEAYFHEMEKFRADDLNYRAQLTPAQVEQNKLDRKERQAKKMSIRKKREQTALGKPKRPRSAFNIFMSEHYEEARGTTLQARLKSMVDDWRNLLGHQRQVYTQLAMDDKIRYKNEIKSWEEHMLDIGRDDLIRERTLSTKRGVMKQQSRVAQSVKDPATGKSKATTKSSTTKTVRTTKKA